MNIYKEEKHFWQVSNIIIFWQKELWGGHFQFGKWDAEELKTFEPEQLVEYYKQQFGSTEPFEKEALTIIAGLSRGIFRWYKKYIRVSLDNYYDRTDKTQITVEDIKKWITIDRLTEDYERELIDVFPKARGQRRKAVQVLVYLREHGETPQSQIQLAIFGEEPADKTACSRMLTKLEDAGYITRRYEKKEKLVKIV